MTKLLLTGATGRVGGALLGKLLDLGVGVRILARDLSAFAGRGLDVVRGDLAEPESLGPALAGISGVFLYAQGNRADELGAVLHHAGVAHAVVLSTIDATSDRPFARYNKQRHLGFEHAVAASVPRVTCLRPGAFASNALRFWAPSIRQERVVRLPYPDAEQAPIDERDLAEVAVRALLSRDLDGQTPVLTGPASLSQREQVKTIAAALCEPIRIETVSPEEARVALGKTIPPAYVELLIAQWSDEVGRPAVVTDAVERVTGRAATPYAGWVARNVERFR